MYFIFIIKITGEGKKGMKLSNKVYRILFSGLLSLALVFSTFAVTLAAGGNGSGGGDGKGNGGGNGGDTEVKEPVTLEGAYLTVITDNASTTGENLNGNKKVGTKPSIKLVFNKNVVSNFAEHKGNFILTDSDGNEVPIDVSVLSDENEKRNIFVSPTEELVSDKAYTLIVKSGVKANNGTILEKDMTITFTVNPSSESENPKDEKTFEDVNNGKDWAEKYIEALASKGIIHGKTKDIFAPNDSTTRVEFAVLLVRALDLKGSKYDGRFKDVKGSEWFNNKNELMAAVESGIIKGKEDGRFAPNDEITRTEAAVMLGRALKLETLNFDSNKLDVTKKISDFNDSNSIGEWAKADIKTVYQAGIIDGKTNGEFDPNGITKRNQTAKMLAMFLVASNLMNNVFND